MMRSALFALVLALAAPAAAQDEPGLEAVAADGVRMCMSIAEGRVPAEAATIFGFAPSEALFQRETAKGKIEVLPPDATRRSCRVQVNALVVDEKAVLDAIAALVTAPPHSFAPLQSRVAERIGYISTAGGAFLEFLEGRTLPAVAALEERGDAST